MRNSAVHNNWISWMFTAGVFFILVSGSLLSEGMFVDGVTYAAISRNMAFGQGTFWNPYYTASLYPVFHQHPPLALAMESLFFKILGDSVVVERLYSVMVFALTGLMICLVWKRMTGSFCRCWLPVLFWISIPIVSWGATNNMLEGTMSVFVMASVMAMMDSLAGNRYINLFLASVMLFLAFLSKGFTGLFTLTFPLVCCLVGKKSSFKEAVIDTLVLVAGVALCFVILFLLSSASYEALGDYLRVQVMNGIAVERTVGSRFFILGRLCAEIAVPFVVLSCASLVACRLHRYSRPKLSGGWDRVFFVVGLAGVLPIMVSVKQSGFYMLSALPFFALSLAFFAVEHIDFDSAAPKMAKTMWLVLASLVLTVGLALNVNQYGKYGRDEALLTDIKTILPYLEENEVISIPEADFPIWINHAYFMRYGKTSLSSGKGNGHLIATCRLENVEGYNYINLNTSKLFLYERK